MSLSNDLGHPGPGQVRAITDRIEALSPDERAVVLDLLDGLERGRVVYGPLEIDADRRDFADEARQEARDWLVYTIADALRRKRSDGTKR